jgi:hypothetical protein
MYIAAGCHNDMSGLPRQVRVIHDFNARIIDQIAKYLLANSDFAGGQIAAFKLFKTNQFQNKGQKVQ